MGLIFVCKQNQLKYLVWSATCSMHFRIDSDDIEKEVQD